MIFLATNLFLQAICTFQSSGRRKEEIEDYYYYFLFNF
jgi:hypothetical protein